MEMQNPAPPPKNSRFSPLAMDALKKQNKPAETMSVQEIIKHDVETSGIKASPEQVYAGLIQAVSTPKFRVVRANNSLMVFSIDGQGMATAHLMSADDPTSLIDSLKQFHQAMIKAGFKQVKSTLSDPQMLRAIKMAGIKVQESMGHGMSNGVASPAINIVMEA